MGESNTDIVLAELGSRGYESQKCVVSSSQFGVPQARRRVLIIAMLVVANPAFTLETRSVDDVLKTVRSLIKVCLREPPCASELLLPDSHPAIGAELRRRQRTSKRTVYAVGAAMKVAADKGITWAALQAPDNLKASPWFLTLSAQQRDVAAYSVATSPGDHLMRDVSQSLHRVRISCKSTCDRHMAPTLLPHQVMLVFPTDERLPRLLVGHEALLMQGFPVSQTPSAMEGSSNALQMDIAGNMVSLPVLLAMVASTLAAIPWRRADASVPADEDDVAEVMDLFALCAGETRAEPEPRDETCPVCPQPKRYRLGPR